MSYSFNASGGRAAVFTELLQAAQHAIPYLASEGEKSAAHAAVSAALAAAQASGSDAQISVSIYGHEAQAYDAPDTEPRRAQQVTMSFSSSLPLKEG